MTRARRSSSNSLKPLDAKIADMRKKYAGLPVTASEPVFGYQAGLIGLKVHNEKFALAVMNNAEPTASEVAGVRERSQGPQGEGDALQRPGERAGGGASGADGQGQRNSRSSASPRPSRRTRPIRSGCSGSSTRSTRRSAARPSERAPLRRRDHSARRPGHSLGRQFRRRGPRIHRHARRQRRRQDDADARRARPDAGRRRGDQRSRSARHARTFVDRLHAAKPRAARRACG